MITTDGFTVQPLEFPGGDIGSLAVHGTVNDLAVAGATPLYLSLNAFIQEGLEVALLDRLISSTARAAEECGVRVAAGDTKVLRRGEGGGLYLATTGIGIRRPGLRLGVDRISDRDVVRVSGPLGDHDTAVLLAREDFGLKGDLLSDAASVLPLTAALLPLPGLRFMRDPTRGGLVTVMHDIAGATGLTVRLDETAIPIHPPVRGACHILGYDPLYLACEGRVAAVLSPDDAPRAGAVALITGRRSRRHHRPLDRRRPASRSADRDRRRTAARRTRGRPAAAYLLGSIPAFEEQAFLHFVRSSYSIVSRNDSSHTC